MFYIFCIFLFVEALWNLVFFLHLNVQVWDVKFPVSIATRNLKHESFARQRETIDKMERQPTKWEKIFPNHMSDKGSVWKTHKEPI